MMNHPVLMQARAEVHYDEMLKAAETARQVKRLSRQQIGLLARLRSAADRAPGRLTGRRTDPERTVLRGPGVA